MPEEEIVDLYVYLCSDGTLMAYDKDKILNITFSDFISWSRLKEIRAFTMLPSAKRKGLDKQFNIKYVKYYFKNTKTNEVIEIPSEHVRNIVTNLKVVDD